MKCVLCFSVILLLPGLARGGSSGYGALVNVGCFDLGYSLRMNYHRHVPGVTLGDCVTLCSNSGVKYAGVERSDNFCYCGQDIAENSEKRNDSLCNINCSDYVEQKCGGDWLMSVFDISGEPTRVTTTTMSPLETKDAVGMIVGTSSGVTLYNSSNMNSPKAVLPLLDWAYSVDYHWKRNLLFTYSRKKILKSSLLSPSFSPVLVKDVTVCDGFAVDWEQDRIFYGDCSINISIKSMDLEGGNVISVFMRPGPRSGIRRIEIDPYNKVLFWLADGIIESCSITGQNYKTNMSAPGVVVRAITLDLRAQRVLYVGLDNSTSSLYSMDYQGSSQQKIFSLPVFKSVYGMGLLKNTLYWVNYANTRDIIYKVPFHLSSSEDVKVIKPLDKAVWHMKLCHPDLQKRPVSPCDIKECSHSCIEDENNEAQCKCPRGLNLDNDGLTCSGRKSEKLVVEDRGLSSKAIMLSILLVVSAILISLGLLYLGDHYWPMVQARLSAVPYKREGRHQEGLSPQYDTTEDNVNLV